MKIHYFCVCLCCLATLLSRTSALAQIDDGLQPSVDLAESLKVVEEDDEKKFENLEAEVQLTALQPPADQPVTAPPRPTRSSRTRLARAPSMFGDFFAPPSQFHFVQIIDGRIQNEITGTLPMGGALTRGKVSDNGKTLPTDRIFFIYNHFNNAVQNPGSLTGPPLPDMSVDRYVAGFEKTFFNENCSFELRVPFSTPVDFSTPPMTDPAVFIPAEELGNLNLIFKALVHESDNFACAIGLGIDLPTANDVRAIVDPFPPGPPGPFPGPGPGGLMSFQIDTDTVYLQPFAAFLATPGQSSFVQGFVQFDVPTGGNPVTVTDPGAIPMSTSLGNLNDPSLLHVDLAFGHWLYQNPAEGLIQGIAGAVELHYITTLQDADTVFGQVPGGSELTLGNPFNRQDFLDLTAGLHVQLGANTTVRVAGVAPLRTHPDRTFDGELTLQVNHFFR
jgi:hypothetical protein